MTLAELRNEYRPYDTLPAFDRGFADYERGYYGNPFDGCRNPGAGVNAQAWDRGLECAMKWNNRRDG
jgi:hypothetical protein